MLISEVLSISFSEEATEDGVISIYNLAGQKVKTIPFEKGLAAIELDLAKLTSGIYLLQMNLNGNILASKVIKE